jgi:ElaB/YqjD/DUF883 family membrane-anchored ribosome-binding protein
MIEDNIPMAKTPASPASPAAKPAARRTTAKAATAKPAAKKAAKPAAKAADGEATAVPLRDQINARTDAIRTEATRKAGEIGDEMRNLYGQATERAADVARQGKGRAVEGLESLAKVIDDASTQVDDRLGKQYGDYARSAASTVAGLAGSLDEKDLDELVASTRDFVRKSPAVAIGSAAVVGFMLARLLRNKDS